MNCIIMEAVDVYFKTGAHCYIVLGEHEASLYDLSENILLNISLIDAEKLLQLDQGRQVEHIDNMNYDLLSKLVETGLGQYYKSNVYIDKIRFGLPPSIKDFAKNRLRLYNLYMNISPVCNMDCVFCRTDDHVNRMTGCKRFSQQQTETIMTVTDYLTVLETSYNLGCRTLHITGGEPLLEGDTLAYIIEAAQTLGYSNIFIYTNLLLLDKLDLQKIKVGSFIVHGLAHTQTLLDRMLWKKSDISQFYDKMKKLQESNIPFYFNLILNSINYKYKKEIIEYYNQFNPRGIQYSYIHEIGDDDDYNDILFSDKAMASCFTDMSFFHNLDFHPCLNGKLTVFSNGDITVCPMMRDEVIGNMLEQSFEKIIAQKKYLDYWKHTLDKVEMCQDCNSRYACMDCRAIEKSAGGKLSSKRYCKHALKESFV